jgi:hypothetical protein
MSAQPVRRGTKLAITGAVVSVIAVLGYFTLAMRALLYLPFCQPDGRWIRTGECGVLRLRLAAMLVLFSLGAILAGAGLVLRFHERSLPR